MAISDSWSGRPIGLGEYIDILDMKDHYSVNVTVFVYKLMKRLRKELGITWNKSRNEGVSGDVNFEEYVEGSFEYDMAESIDPLGILEREQAETAPFDNLMPKPDNIIYYYLNPVIVAALMEDIDWLKRYSEIRNIFDDARNGEIYVYDNAFNYQHTIYAMW